MLCAALAEGTSHITNIEYSKDIRATLGAAAQLGAKITEEAHSVTIKGHGTAGGFVTVTRPVFCNESGSTLRFMIPLFSLTAQKVRFTGAGRLFDRPQAIYQMLFERQGLQFEQTPEGITIFGRLRPGGFTLPGDVSSQFITGLLYALPLLEGDSELVLTTALESRGYVDMTLDALAQFGVSAEYDGDRRFRVPGNQVYRHRDLAIEGDWSNAAFWFAAAFLGHRVDVEGLNPRSVQGDRVIGEQLARLTRPGPAELDVSQCPDLVPPLAAMAALRAGETTAIVNAARLRIKESDRLSGMVEELLDFSRLQSGRLKLSLTKIDLVAELSDAVLMFTERARQEGIALNYDEPMDILPIMGDSNRLRQVFVNILDNALKYSDAGDSVTVTVQHSENNAIIQIRDTGIGIASEDLPKVKTRFYKANATRRGSGIGLAVADEIVSMHGGNLSLDSQEGEGTTVTISLPLAC